MHIIVATLKEGQVHYQLERKIPLVTIKSIAMSSLRDDWLVGPIVLYEVLMADAFVQVLNLGPTEEGDPLISCVLKTELCTHMLQLTSGSINITIGPVYVLNCLFCLFTSLSHCVCSVDYNKKKEKKAQVKFIKDETVPRDDVYKSHTVHVPSGEPPDSLSRPPAKRKAGVVRPITQGKLLRKGGPSDVCRLVIAPLLRKPRSTNVPCRNRPHRDPGLQLNHSQASQHQQLSLSRVSRPLPPAVPRQHLPHHQFGMSRRLHPRLNQTWTCIVPSSRLRARRAKCR